MDQKCLPSWRNPARYPTSPDADAFVHASHLMGGVHQRGGRRAAHRAAHRGAVGPERSGRSILKITSLCRCAGPQEAAFCVLRAMRHRGCYGISGRVFEHRVLPEIPARAGLQSRAGTGLSRSPAPRKRSATTQTTHTALRRGSCCTLCSRLRPQLRRWKAASEAPQRGRGRRMRFCYSQLELAALPEVEGDAQKNDILTGRVSPKLALDATKEGGS